jgi:4-amino-4-deoxy-L-arabinose transferase-like glycosyltransferase
MLRLRIQGNNRTVLSYLLCIIIVSLLVRIPFVFFVHHNPSVPFTSHDSFGYNVIAKNIIHNHSFSLYLDNPEIKDPVRTPGYPLFLAIVYSLLSDNPLYVVALQMLLGCVTALLIFLLVRIVWGMRSAFIAGLLYSINFHQVIFEMQLLTEILFTLVLLLSVVLFILYLKKRSILILILSAFFLSLAITIRPIAIFFPIIPLAFLLERKVSLRMVILFTLIVIILPTIWVVRNSMVFRRIFYTKIHSVNLVLYHAPSIIADLGGITRSAAKDEFLYSMKVKYSLTQYDIEHFDDNPDLTDLFAKEAKKVIIAYPFLFVKNQVFGIIHTTIPLNIGFTADVLTGKGAGGSGLKPMYRTFIHLFSKGSIGKSFRLLTGREVEEISVGIRIFMIFMFVYQLFLYVLAVIGVIRRGRRFEKLFFVFLIAYFILLSGGVGEARFRAGVEPFIALLASVALLRKGNGKSNIPN